MGEKNMAKIKMESEITNGLVVHRVQEAKCNINRFAYSKQTKGGFIFTITLTLSYKPSCVGNEAATVHACPLCGDG